MPDQIPAPVFPSHPAWEEIASEIGKQLPDTERLLVIVSYRWVHEGVEATDTRIAANYYRRARWPRPVNLSATANHCAGKGWLSEAGRIEGRKLWRITFKGYEAIAHTRRGQGSGDG